MGLFGFSGKKKLPYQLRLFVAGESSHTNAILECLYEVLDEKIEGQYNLEILNVMMDHKAAKECGVVSTPTLVWLKPEPVRKIFGSLYLPEKMREALSFIDELKQKKSGR